MGTAVFTVDTEGHSRMQRNHNQSNVINMQTLYTYCRKLSRLWLVFISKAMYTSIRCTGVLKQVKSRWKSRDYVVRSGLYHSVHWYLTQQPMLRNIACNISLPNPGEKHLLCADWVSESAKCWLCLWTSHDMRKWEHCNKNTPRDTHTHTHTHRHTHIHKNTDTYTHTHRHIHTCTTDLLASLGPLVCGSRSRTCCWLRLYI